MTDASFIYPGLNGLLRRTDRNRYLALPEVQNRMGQAEKIVSRHRDHKVLLHEFLLLPTAEIYSVDNISTAAVVICAIQCGIADRLRSLGCKPKWVMGCSLGDLARAVFADAYSFEDAVSNHMRFTTGISGIEKIGRNIGVAAPPKSPFSDEDYGWFNKIGVDVSRLTSRFLNIGGRHAELALVESRAVERQWHVMPILEYPAHSRYILPFVERVAQSFGSVEVRLPSTPIFSSLSAKPLTDPVDIRNEFLLSITQPIHWERAVLKLAQEHGIREFINIGPCRSLSKMMKEIDASIVVIEAEDVIGKCQ